MPAVMDSFMAPVMECKGNREGRRPNDDLGRGRG
jgi:hypothetical protein